MHTELWANAGSREYREALTGNREDYTRQCNLWPLVSSMAVLQATCTVQLLIFNRIEPFAREVLQVSLIGSGNQCDRRSGGIMRAFP